ncbi:MAG: protein translocase subunit SecD [Spirochaetes bacterium]|nr:protein translocase subunit SecD [Spirochaetota bacterium]
MKKTSRLLFVIFLIGSGVFFLLPTIRWYFFFDSEKRNDAALTGERLKAVVERRIDETLAKLDSGEELPELEYLQKEYIAYIKKVNKLREYNKYEEDKNISYTQLRDNIYELKKNNEKYATAYLREKLEDHYQDYYKKLAKVKDGIIRLGLDLQGGSYAIVTVNFDHPSILEKYPEDQYPNGIPAEDKKAMIDSAVIKIRNRIDKYGVSEVSIQKLRDQNKIKIDIPGEKRPEGLRAIIETVGVLEFKLISKDGSKILNDLQAEYAAQGMTIFDETGKNVKPEVLTQLPPDTEILFISNKDKWGVDSQENLMVNVVEKESLLGSNPQVDSASVQPGQMGNYVINFVLKGDSAQKWAQVTGDNVGREIAIILDDVILTNPVVDERIPNGRSQVRLGDTPYEDLQTLALILRSGSLNVPMEISEENTVGASLGRDTIEKGITALVIGSILVLLFMMVYYSIGGIIANLVLVLNTFFLLAGLGLFNGTLTLPGIAGIILTIGMAVDANVIIYERIKEEFRSGKTFKTAVNLGFDRAFLTIMDANLTTFFAAIGLALFGTGTIKGFAVTLCLGIVCSLFTSLFVTRLVLDTLTSYVDFKTLRVFSLLRGK